MDNISDVSFSIEYILQAAFNSTPSTIITAFILSFFLIAPTEELLKFFVVLKWIYNQLEFDEVMDGIVYCVASSLGFATVENIRGAEGRPQINYSWFILGSIYAWAL